jgi:perosamine synthetase
MLPQIQPWIDNEEMIQLQRVIQSTYLVEHDLTKEFEELTRQLTGARYAIALANGTVGLYCGLLALGIGPGDEVIIPDLTFIATANAVIMAGATPVFCDILKDTFCIDVNAAKSLITPKTKAIMPVHLYGQSADMDAVLELARAKGLKVIEDAAQGVGVRWNGKHVGTFGDCGILSYYGNKTITCGEGGVILTDNEELAKKCYRLKNHGREKKGVFVHEEIGFNFSFTEMQAAIGIAQMHKLDRIIKRKKEIFETYCIRLADLASSGLQALHYDPRCTPVYWFTSFLSSRNDDLATYLQANGVQTRKFFYPLHLQPCYAKIKNPVAGFTVSTAIFNKGISLPSSYSLTAQEQDLVIQLIRKFYESGN